MTLEQVRQRYMRGVEKQFARRNRQNRTEFTPNELRVIEFYRTSARQVGALINQGETCQP